MANFFGILWLACTLLRLTCAASLMERSTHPTIRADGIPLPPSEDPFYTGPHGYEKATPGAVLRVRSVPEFAKGIANCSAAYNILYRTTDSNYAPAWAVTTLLIPEPVSKGLTANDTAISPGSILLSYQVSCKYTVQLL